MSPAHQTISRKNQHPMNILILEKAQAELEDAQRDMEKILELRGKVTWEGDLDEMRRGTLPHYPPPPVPSL